MRVLIMQLNSIAIMDIVAYGGAAAGIIVAIFQPANGNITIFETLIIILLSSEFFIPIRTLGSFFHTAMNASTAANKIFNILDIKEKKKGDSFIPKKLTFHFKMLVSVMMKIVRFCIISILKYLRMDCIPLRV